MKRTIQNEKPKTVKQINKNNQKINIIQDRNKITLPNKVDQINNSDTISENDRQELDVIQNQIQQNEKFYCTNANLLKEMYKWRNSSTNGLPVMKMDKSGKLIPTETNKDTDQKHEQFKKRTHYYIKYPKTHKRYLDWISKLKKQQTKQQVGRNILDKNCQFPKPNFYKVSRIYVIEDVTKIVEYNGWTFDIDDPLDPKTGRVMSENFGRMIMMIAQKISNHSYFRNYPLELKQDCQSYSYEKIIKGLFNYSFRFTNAFAYISQACFNSFKSILSKHYKYINTKRALTKKAMVDLDVEIPGSSMRKSLENQFKGNDYDSFQEF